MPEIDTPHEEIEQAEIEPAGLDTQQEVPPGDDAIADASVPAEAIPAAEAEDSKHWYIIHTYSGFERKVAESLRTRAEAFGFNEQIGQILIPEEEVVELRNGKKVTSKRLLYPGYVVVQMEMNRSAER